jgi:F-type H+-transporting ATPase subunit alpha
VEKQILIIYAGTNGFVDELPLNALKKYEQELYSFMESKHADIFADILKKRELDGELRGKLNKALEEFKGVFKS